MSASNENERAYWLAEHAKWHAELKDWDSRWDQYRSDPSPTHDAGQKINDEYELWCVAYTARSLEYNAFFGIEGGDE